MLSTKVARSLTVWLNHDSGRSWFPWLEGENAVQRHRDLLGATNGERAAAVPCAQTTLTASPKNGTHGSDSVESAARENRVFSLLKARFARAPPNLPRSHATACWLHSRTPGHIVIYAPGFCEFAARRDVKYFGDTTSCRLRLSLCWLRAFTPVAYLCSRGFTCFRLATIENPRGSAAVNRFFHHCCVQRGIDGQNL